LQSKRVAVVLPARWPKLGESTFFFGSLGLIPLPDSGNVSAHARAKRQNFSAVSFYGRVEILSETVPTYANEKARQSSIRQCWGAICQSVQNHAKPRFQITNHPSDELSHAGLEAQIYLKRAGCPANRGFSAPWARDAVRW
jgi:hypothetical protein